MIERRDIQSARIRQAARDAESKAFWTDVIACIFALVFSGALLGWMYKLITSV